MPVPSKRVPVGSQAPAFTLPTTGEGEASLRDYRGDRCVVLVFLNQRGGGGHRDGESAEGEGAGHGDRRYSGEG